MSDDPELAPGRPVAGTPYRVVAPIGSGGMSAVYEVEHLELGKRFVLKALLPRLRAREELVRRMRNEWRALARLEHPAIVGVTDAGVTASGTPFYVMERLRGETLAARLERAGRLPEREAARIAAAVLDGLAAAHAIGLVHRDVKPPNVFLVADAASGGAVKLLDFGIAKSIDPDEPPLSRRGSTVGTPRYMSPEQAAGGTVDGRADLYAVGLLLFEMVTGRAPFAGHHDPSRALLSHLLRPAPRLASVAPGVDPGLDDLVAWLLAKRPEERPASAAMVARWLQGAAPFSGRRHALEALRPPVGTAAPAAEPPPVEPGSIRRETTTTVTAVEPVAAC